MTEPRSPDPSQASEGPEEFSEFDDLVASVREAAEAHAPIAARLPESDASGIDPAGFLFDWPGLRGRLIEELR